MQSEQYDSQPKRLRTEAKTSADSSASASTVDDPVDGSTVNKRETIDNLINTLQRLRDGDDNSLASSAVDVLSSMARGCTVQPSTAPTTDLSNNLTDETRVPALQAVPYIVPQQKLELPSWSDFSLQGLTVPYLFHRRQMCSSLAAATPQLDFTTAASFPTIVPFPMYQL
ncbi:hypothetical protein GCK32_010666, partial [Trichostrongylus colubriformis]